MPKEKRPKPRKFNGKLYRPYLKGGFIAKNGAQTIARKVRKPTYKQDKPLLARVIKYQGKWHVMVRPKKETPTQNLSPRSGGSKGATHVRAHARKGTRGVRAHTRKR